MRRVHTITPAACLTGLVATAWHEVSSLPRPPAVVQRQFTVVAWSTPGPATPRGQHGVPTSACFVLDVSWGPGLVVRRECDAYSAGSTTSRVAGP